MGYGIIKEENIFFVAIFSNSYRKGKNWKINNTECISVELLERILKRNKLLWFRAMKNVMKQ